MGLEVTYLRGAPAVGPGPVAETDLWLAPDGSVVAGEAAEGILIARAGRIIPPAFRDAVESSAKPKKKNRAPAANKARKGATDK